MEIIALSDIGNVRSVNQDYVRYYQKNEHECLVVLCDGMGGHNAGEIASSLTCDDIIEQYSYCGAFSSEEEIKAWMSDAIYHAHHIVKEKSYESPEMEGMGTTVVMALLLNNKVYISHVGDSRAYLYDNQQLCQLTKDDTLVNVLVDSGTISANEAKYHPQKNILLQAVGVSDILKISFLPLKIDRGMILLCSDGLYNSLSDEQMKDILGKNINIDDKGKELMRTANIYGGKDNIGFALILNEGVVNHESNS